MISSVYRYLHEVVLGVCNSAEQTCASQDDQNVGLQQWVFEEMKAVREMSFRFHQEQEAADYCQTLAADMLKYPDHLSVAGGHLLSTWEPRLVRAICSYLTPHNMRATLLSKDPAHSAKVTAAVAAEKARAAVEGTTVEPSTAFAGVEPWFGVEYACEHLPASVGTVVSAAVAALPMGMPPVNKYIPTNFDLLPSTADSCNSDFAVSGGGEFDVPELLSLCEHTEFRMQHDFNAADQSEQHHWLELFWKPDRIFSTPRAAVFLEIQVLTIAQPLGHPATIACICKFWQARPCEFAVAGCSGQVGSRRWQPECWLDCG